VQSFTSCLHKKNIDFNFQPLSTFVVWIFIKIVSLEVVHPLKIYQHTKYHGPTLNGKNFASPQKFERPPVWNDYSTELNIWFRGHLQWHVLST